MSSSFPTNVGSRETLKPRRICGFRPLACQCRMTVLAHTSITAPNTASSTVPNTAPSAAPSTAPILRVLQGALAPARDLHPAHAQCLGNVLVLQTLRGQQHDARSQRHANTRTLERTARASLVNSASCASLNSKTGATRNLSLPCKLKWIVGDA